MWARENGCPWDVDTSAAAAWGGDLEMLKWLQENGCPWSVDAFAAAAADGGHLEMLNWALENGCCPGLEDDDDEMTSEDEHSSEWETVDEDLEEDSE
jgi:hypothetical protein